MLYRLKSIAVESISEKSIKKFGNKSFEASFNELLKKTNGDDKLKLFTIANNNEKIQRVQSLDELALYEEIDSGEVRFLDNPSSDFLDKTRLKVLYAVLFAHSNESDLETLEDEIFEFYKQNAKQFLINFN